MVQSDYIFSLRNYLSGSKMKQFVAYMTTTTLSRIVPGFLGDFEPNKQIDIAGSLSQKAIEAHTGQPIHNGLTIEKNGNFKLVLHSYMEIIIQSSDENAEVKAVKARKIVAGIAFKGKITL